MDSAIADRYNFRSTYRTVTLCIADLQLKNQPLEDGIELCIFQGKDGVFRIAYDAFATNVGNMLVDTRHYLNKLIAKMQLTRSDAKHQQ